MAFPPTVLYPLTLVGLLHHILTTQSGTAATTLVICSSRDTFLGSLSQSLQQGQSNDENRDLQNMVTPSLQNLFTARHIKLAFCASVQALLAYLTAYGQDGHAQTVEPGQKARIVLVSPLALHTSTMSFSAQGLSRAFAAASEAALKTNTVLYVVECCVEKSNCEQQSDAEDTEMSNGSDEEHVTEQGVEDPWEQEMPILNVSARRFGSSSGERAWAGRTVKAKNVAARWLRFQKLEDDDTCEGRE
jgi:hypothetical protein